MANSKNPNVEMASLLGLPAELLHRVFSFMKQDGILAARTCCSRLADIGRDRMLSEIFVVYERSRLQRLKEIASRPHLAHRVRSLYFQADRFAPTGTFETWNMCRDGGNVWSDMNLKGKMKAHPTENELLRAYTTYQQAVNDQIAVGRDGFDQECLTDFFQSCTNLDLVTLALGNDFGDKRRPRMIRSAFEECHCAPFGDTPEQDRGVDQFHSIFRAFQLSDHKIKRFHAFLISLSVVDLVLPQLKSRLGILQNLQELRLHMVVEAGYRTLPSASLNSYGLADMLSAAPNLRTLDLQTTSKFPFPNVAKLERLFGPHTWPKLENLTISGVQSSNEDLVDLLIRHGETLRSLALAEITLLNGTVTEFVKRIQGHLPVLETVKMQEQFTIVRQPPKTFLAGVTWEQIDELQDFILNGGGIPHINEPA